ncbi:hypothetical protein BGW36DRAFT_304662 [Talaromyces proteolyticus]|uniref:RING-type domain-containing protein n=1 Tax=Talaromyces proteolyticus TaxID=1131652 RepID=A0AAD4KHE6_9EURO|nr:uncharacterized protein BGW36DRAFT_304662 [Talaromyces proteolyticus]KAH8691249.1 hypothetical protein BGW36DRAFT_304662 [Talaromyces proteolyticus]
MGQASSTQRDQRQENASRSILPSRPHSDGNNGILNTQDMSGQPLDTHLPHGEAGDAHRHSIFNLETDPTPSYLPDATNSDNITSTDMVGYPQEMESVQPGTRSAAVSRLISRRQSTMSRLGSRILPNSVIRGLLSSEEETPAEGHAHRNGRFSRSLSRAETTHSARFSPFNSFGSRGITRRRSIRGPYPLPRGDSALNPDSPPNSTYINSTFDTLSGSHRGWRRSPRLNRVRNSLSTPISHIFGPSPTLAESEEARVPPQRPSRSSIPDDFDQLLPPITPMDTTMGFNEATEMDSLEPSMEASPPISPRSRMNHGPGPVRRLPGILRTRPPRLQRPQDQTSLSRVLQLAAAAIAAQLSGSAVPTLPNIQSLGNDGLDASLENLISSLQQATSNQGSPSGASGSQTPSSDGNVTPTPVNFLRVFRFANSENQGRSNGETRENMTPRVPDQMDIDDSGEETNEGRTVTLVVVGVRSVPTNGPVGGNQQNNSGMGLDALLGLPLMPSNAMPRDRASTGSLFRNADGSPRLPPPRPVNGATNSFLPGLDNQARTSLSNSSQRRADMNPADGSTSVLPTSLSESPPGPNPPPSTPAEPTLSTVSSENSTPSRRPSSASAMFPNILPQVHEESSEQPAVESETAANTAAPAGARQRRRSDSEFARHRHLGLGAARRNGVVEPDQPSPSIGRTWVIYVVGTNLSENHPAFATPSLFTENPTYEDMILLSSLLGPAKPPVATEADVTSAGGLFRLVEYAGALVAESLEGEERIGISETERCLICLSEYEAADEVRQLSKCKHIYHKECIDQWLTTGRNSCPLCRGQGVTESSASNNSNNLPTQEASA